MTVAKIDDLRAAIASVSWSYWVNLSGPVPFRFSVDMIGDTFKITSGSSDRERTWDLQLTPTGVVLTVWGEHGGPTFFASWNGEEFTGHWIDFKNIAVRIVPNQPLRLDVTDLHYSAKTSPVPFCVGIPTLHCYDLCRMAIDAVLNSSILPESIFVVDNGTEMERFSHPHPLVSVIRANRNLGVAKSWNLLHKLASPRPLVILNDDISIGRNCLEKLITCDAPIATLDQRRAYEAFMIREEIWSAIGEFDEAFWPAYHEDSDHSRRLQLAGVSVVCPMNQGALQRGPSATKLRMTPEQHREFCQQYDRCREYFLRKWGGLPNQEVYLSPFAKASA